MVNGQKANHSDLYLALTVVLASPNLPSLLTDMEENRSFETEALRRARDRLATQADSMLEEQIELARVPAPPFHERERSEVIAAKLGRLGVGHELDSVGNLLAWFPNASRSSHPSPIVVATHVDTVFGPETSIDIRPQGSRWVGPGITDNARGLAVALAVLRALIHADVRPQRPILFVFTVGEEGPGDLRGVKQLFADASPLRDAAAFIAVDGSGLRRIIHRALGSRRFRITIRGAGGHSWTDWGRSNPANAIGEFIHRIAELDLPKQPRTVLTAARHGGGTSINAIPDQSWVELDLRSEDNALIEVTEAQLREALQASVAAEEARAEGLLNVSFELIGERPAGALDTSHSLVQAAVTATLALDVDPQYAVSSTDANVPLALGIPSIAIGGGGESGDTHTVNEWFRDADGAAGAIRLLAILSRMTGF
jgi:acetylornithine deacetylase/succinyl-diaminopimelate desuccinylase-like protein